RVGLLHQFGRPGWDEGGEFGEILDGVGGLGDVDDVRVGQQRRGVDGAEGAARDCEVGVEVAGGVAVLLPVGGGFGDVGHGFVDCGGGRHEGGAAGGFVGGDAVGDEVQPEIRHPKAALRRDLNLDA